MSATEDQNGSSPAPDEPSPESTGSKQSAAMSSAWVLSVEGLRIWIPLSARVSLGLAGDGELDLDHFLRCVHEDDRERVHATARRAVRSGKSFVVEYRLVFADGTVRWMSSRGRHHFRSGKPTNWFVGVSNDITDRLRVEGELSRTDAFLSAVQSAGHAGFWAWDLVTGEGFCTPGLEAIYGLPPGTAASNRDAWSSLTHPDDLEATRAELERCLAEQRPEIVNEHRIIRPDGTVRWLWNRGFVTYDETGQPLRLSGTTVDVTERRQIEEQTRCAAETWEATFDSMSTPMMLLNVDHTVVRANAAMRSFISEPNEEVIGRRFHQLLHGTEECSGDCPLRKLLETRAHVETELYDQRRGRWLHVVLDPLLDDAGSIMGAVHWQYDITDRKLGQQRLQQFNYELQQRELALALELRESKARRERIAAIVPGVICEYRFSPEGNSHFLYLSPRCDQLFEIDAYALLQDAARFWNLIHPDDAATLKQAMSAANRDTAVVTAEVRLRTPSGRAKWIQITIHPSPAGPAHSVAHTAVIFDITNRRQAEVEVHRLLHELETLKSRHQAEPVAAGPPPAATPAAPGAPAAPAPERDKADRARIRRVLNRTHWRVRGKNGAAEILGMNPDALLARMNALDIRRPRKTA